MVMRYGRRLWKLRVLQAELKMGIRLTPTGETILIRLFITNESGYYLDISLYKEVTDPTTGQVTLPPCCSFCSFSDPEMFQVKLFIPCWLQIMFQSYTGKHGPLHGMIINSPYVTKDLLQAKRFQAQSLGTTYVYDFPELFRQVCVRPPITLCVLCFQQMDINAVI